MLLFSSFQDLNSNIVKSREVRKVKSCESIWPVWMGEHGVCNAKWSDLLRQVVKMVRNRAEDLLSKLATAKPVEKLLFQFINCKLAEFFSLYKLRVKLEGVFVEFFCCSQQLAAFGAVKGAVNRLCFGLCQIHGDVRKRCLLADFPPPFVSEKYLKKILHFLVVILLEINQAEF